MHKLVILVKSYIGDIAYIDRLIKSYNKYNIDNLPLYLVVPNSDIEKFNIFKNKFINIISEEKVSNNLVFDYSIRNIRPGYINQQIIKLSFWELFLCENYFIMDSDGVFIKNFHIKDFMYDENTPYSILAEDNELIVDPLYYKTYWVEREKLIREIQKKIDFYDRRILTCHSFAIFSTKVLKNFKEKFMIPNGLNYKDLMQISPYEFSWYNMWLQKSKIIQIEFREPLIKFFHQKSHHIEYINKGVSVEDISRGYIGYNINSNYSRNYGVVNYEDDDIYQFSKTEIASQLKILLSMVRKKIKFKIKKLINV